MKSLKSEESVGGGELEYGTCLAVETVTVIRLSLKCSVSVLITIVRCQHLLLCVRSIKRYNWYLVRRLSAGGGGAE